MPTVFYAEMPWPEVEARIAAGAPVFLPLGATEQHGRHMALNVDVVLPTAIAARAAAKVGGLVLPTVAYGNRSQPKTGGGPQFPGTLNLTANTFSLIVRDVICDLYRQKVRKANSPMLAARLGRDRKQTLRRDWESVKVGMMRAAVQAKFTQHADLRALLLSTGDAKLVEHTENDDYWGDGGDGSGKNMLGMILMDVRDELRQPSSG